MCQECAVPRGPAPETRERILQGALQCLREHGEAGTSVAAVARAAGVSRPTLYAHFTTLDHLVQQAVERATLELSARILARVAGAPTAADEIVEFVVAAHREFKADPVAALVVQTTLAPGLDDRGTITPRMLRLAREPMRKALAREPEALERLDELVETMTRFLLSVLTYSSRSTRTDAALRGYLHRALVPALGLRPVVRPWRARAVGAAS